MAVTEVFDKLKALQDILAEKYSLMAKIEDSPKQLSTQDELLVRLQKEFLETSAVYESVKAEVGQLQLELDEAEKAREAGEKGMDSISTHREYEALEKQINEASAKESGIRSELQRKEKQREELNEKLRLDEEMIKAQETDLNSNKAKLDSEVKEYENQIKELEAKEKEITPGLDSEIVYKFQRIIQRNSEGIVAVKNGVCTGCHMILPAQFANEVRKGEDILFCPYCSRILFYEESADNESAYTTADSGNLVGEDDEEDLLDDKEFEDEEMDSSDLNSSDYE